MNGSAGPDGFVPTLLVYEALPCLAFSNYFPTLSTFQCAVVLCKATEALSNYFAKTQVSRAVRTRNGPDTSDIHSTPIDSHVLVYCSELDRRDEPFTLLLMKRETCTVQLPPSSGPKDFHSTVLKRSIPESIHESGNKTIIEDNGNALHPLTLTVQSTENIQTEKWHNIEVEEVKIYAAKMIPEWKYHKNMPPLEKRNWWSHWKICLYASECNQSWGKSHLWFTIFELR